MQRTKEVLRNYGQYLSRHTTPLCLKSADQKILADQNPAANIWFKYSILEGPLPHDQPTYAGLPGINVYGMLCVPQSSKYTVDKLKISQRPMIQSTYRTRNMTIDSTPIIENWMFLDKLLNF